MFYVDDKQKIDNSYKFKCTCPICGSRLKPNSTKGVMYTWYCPSNHRPMYTSYSEINEYIRMRSIEAYLSGDKCDLYTAGEYTYLLVDV